MKFQLLGASSPEESARERAHRAIAREAAAEGIVLLENNGVLPMQPQKIALYGAGSRMTVTLLHSDGTSESFEAAHTYNEQQIGWFKAGSALNVKA